MSAYLASASSIVYIGSFASLRTPESTKKLRKEQGLPIDEDEDDAQGLNSSDAWLLPVFGSIVLLSLYLAFKYLDRETILLLIQTYFAVAGVLVLPPVVLRLSRILLGQTILSRWAKQALVFSGKVEWTCPASKRALAQPSLRLNRASMVLSVVALGLVAVYMVTRHWMLSNVLAVCFAIQGIMLIQLDSFSTGFILLGGLFLYDIFWVFGSTRLAGESVMVKVATNFDGPIKLVVPRNLLPALLAVREHGWGAWPAWKFSLLGLGDIVVPGVFVALALHFDQYLASTRQPSVSFDRFYYRFAKPYFTACIIGYVVGLVLTMIVMHVFQTGQPALLYLSPSCSLAAALVAWRRGEIQTMWRWENPATQTPRQPPAVADKTA
ncbi:hypothetical protein MNAN1_000557 [Malassezia nana]|uniref:Signal peptide peptidase-domain-containing protein n=1 Tax=Malassezia nana TaxID=180528 RepID=A0AAF0EHF0_9BASI|nr:hypothetical protein MNAN1_000557 [Malassezia nana]